MSIGRQGASRRRNAASRFCTLAPVPSSRVEPTTTRYDPVIGRLEQVENAPRVSLPRGRNGFPQPGYRGTTSLRFRSAYVCPPAALLLICACRSLPEDEAVIFAGYGCRPALGVPRSRKTSWMPRSDGRLTVKRDAISFGREIELALGSSGGTWPDECRMSRAALRASLGDLQHIVGALGRGGPRCSTRSARWSRRLSNSGVAAGRAKDALCRWPSPPTRRGLRRSSSGTSGAHADVGGQAKTAATHSGTFLNRAKRAVGRYPLRSTVCSSVTTVSANSPGPGIEMVQAVAPRALSRIK